MAGNGKGRERENSHVINVCYTSYSNKDVNAFRKTARECIQSTRWRCNDDPLTVKRT